MATNEPLSSAADEVAAAEAELKAAQERLAAAKARMAAESAEDAAADDRGDERDDAAHDERSGDELGGGSADTEATAVAVAEADASEAPGMAESSGAAASEAADVSDDSDDSDAAGAAGAEAPNPGVAAVRTTEDIAEPSSAGDVPSAVGPEGASCVPTPPAPVDASSSSNAPRQEPSATVGEPDWVPYSTAQIPTPPSYGSPVRHPGDAVFHQPPAPAGYGYAAPQPQYQAQPQPSAQQPPHAGPGAVPPQQPYYGYAQQPYYQQPYAQPVVSTKDHVAAGLLAIFLGPLGIHKFYLGYNTAGFIMLAVSIVGGLLTLSLAMWVIWVISIIEGILYLTKSQTEFEQMYVLNKREWF